MREHPVGDVGVHDVALILGGAACLWEDVGAALTLLGAPPATENEASWPAGPVIATNEAGAAWAGCLDHWVTRHPEKLGTWQALRRVRGYPDGYEVCSNQAWSGVDVVIAPWGSTSGLLAVARARGLGVRRAVLCGIPMTVTAHFFDAKPWRNAGNAWRGWAANEHKMRGWVRSMSGRTRDMLGAPTLRWLRGTQT
jgi:hypothetical protein